MSADTETAIVTLIRSRVDRCAAGMDRNLQPCGPFVTELQRQQATDLALRWVHAADDMQVTIRDLDAVASLADNALDAIRARDRREAAADEAYRAGLDHPMAYLGTGRNRSWYFTTPPAPSPGEHEA